MTDSNRNSLLGNMSPPATARDTPLTPPVAPFSSSHSRPLSGVSTSSSASPSFVDKQANRSSLSINYLPSKFSRPHSPGLSYQKANKGAVKRGGGREAFADGASRMAIAGDNDYDGVAVDGWFKGGKGHRPKLHWNRFKWILLFTNAVLTTWALCGLIACLTTWFNIWNHADIVRVGNGPELVVSTIATSFAIFTALVGWAGILLNNRPFLAFYTLFCWITFGLLVIPGYLSYKRITFNLEGKVNAQWSRQLGVLGRLRIQNELQCCGYFSPFVEATVSQTCYARSQLPGCKGPYLRFQKFLLKRWYIAAFGIVPAQLMIMLAALLCSNHVTYRFGKGMMPKAYRLNQESMAIIMENYANQLADQYGDDVARDVLAASRSNVNVNELPYQGPDVGPRVQPAKNSPYGHYGPVAGSGSDEGKRYGS